MCYPQTNLEGSGCFCAHLWDVDGTGRARQFLKLCEGNKAQKAECFMLFLRDSVSGGFFPLESKFCLSHRRAPVP